MANKKPDRICSDCIHFKACQSWTSWILENTDARPCRNYETKMFVDSDAYYLGQVDADKRNKPADPLIYGNAIDRYGNPVIRCPACGYELWNMERYCPYCGQRLAKER